MIRFVNAAPGLVPGQLAEIRFGNGNQASAYLATGDAGEAISRLGLAPSDRGRPVLLVCGGADDLAGPDHARASELLGPAIVAAAKTTGAVISDGGTASGVMQIAGLARAQHSPEIPVLVGIAPAGKITYPGGPVGADLVGLQEDHSHFILADSAEWGGETALMVATADALAHGAPVVMTLAGGGRVAATEVLAATRQGWPVFVVTGTGGLADRLAQLWNTYRVPRRRRLAFLLPRSRHRPVPPPAGIAEPDLREIVTTGDLRLVTGTDPGQFSRQLSWELQNEPAVKQAWQRFATYDQLAGQLRKAFTRIQGTILILGVTATLLALIHQQTGGAVLHWAVVAAPILVSVLIALASRSATGQRWVMLRAGAEAIKSEIYRYRTGQEAYGATAPGRQQLTGQEALAARLGAIDTKLMQTQASSGPLAPYDGPLPPLMDGAAAGDDDGLSSLDPERYLRIRVGDQLSYYHSKIRSLSRMRSTFQFLAIASGGAGAIVAAAGQEVWVGLTSGIAAAALAYLGYLQVDNSIVSYNQAASALQSLQDGWDARSAQHRTPEAFHELVTSSESVLTTELSGWVQQMNESLRELAARQADATKQLHQGERSAAS
jgi:SLOG in TRPM, prokaryote/SMODS and SLOG-associating 2TM effector domain 1/Protein of unknown function (DUF4231)